jgi:anthranilate phosphoribosyltransferase
VLEHLGVNISAATEHLSKQLEQVRLAFLFAPAHHPAMRHVSKARRDLGFRTVFNQLGPLANPAAAKRQLIGVFDPSLMSTMAEALHSLGSERVMIVHGDDGLDEISPVTTTTYVKVWDGEISTGKLSPKDFGLGAVNACAIEPGHSLAESADILIEAISNENSPRAHAVLPSAAAALWIAGLVSDLPAGVDLSKAAIASGAARNKLAELASWSPAS